MVLSAVLIVLKPLAILAPTAKAPSPRAMYLRLPARGAAARCSFVNMPTMEVSSGITLLPACCKKPRQACERSA